MKILVTGYTALQQASDRRPIQKIDVPGLIVAELRRQGHEVDWRPFAVGEEPSGYDGAIVCMGPCCSPTSYRCLGAMWLLSRSLPTILFHDDWQTRAVKSHHGTFMRFADAQLAKRWKTGTRFYYATPEEDLASRRRRSALFEVARRFYEGDPHPWWRANLYPQYRWGDRRALDAQGLPGLDRLTVDPSAMIDLLSQRDLFSDAPKAREWFLASLMPHDGWVEKKAKPEWPVVYVGSRKLKAERLKTELDVQARTRESWGTLAPGYSGVALGWWRSRFLYAARSRTILVSDPDVAADGLLGPAYGLSCADVEAAGEGRKGEARLQEIAEAQAAVMLRQCGTRDTFAAEVAAMAKVLR